MENQEQKQDELKAKAEALQKEINKSCFMTVTELAQYRVSIYVSEKAIMIRDNVMSSNSLLIPLDDFISKRVNHVNLDTPASKAEDSTSDE